MSGTDADFDGLSRLYGVDAQLSQHAAVEEGVARPIREFDEAEALVRAKPLDDTTDRGTGRGLEGRPIESGSGAESTGLWVVGVDVEVATSRIAKILISQLWFLVGSCPISRVERLAVALLQI